MIAAALIAVALGLASCSTGSAAPTTSTSGSSTPGTSPTPSTTTSATATVSALEPVRHSGIYLVDKEGRVVITHGFDMIWKESPYYPPDFSSKDVAFLVKNGFSGARIGFIWAGAEPSPNHYDTAYIDQLARINSMLGAAGIRTLVDFHQDDYGAKYASGDGAPLWASLDSSCHTTSDCSVTAALQAFQNLWDNTPVAGVGLIDQFAGAWQRAATALAHAPNLLGFDLFNEPYAGSATHCSDFLPCPSFEKGALPSFYRTVIAAIRKVDPTTTIFYEPVAQLDGNPTALPAPLSSDPNLGFTFHYYDRSCDLTANPATAAEQTAQDVQCTPAEQTALAAGIAYARRAGAAVDFGEFGGSANFTDDANMVDLATNDFLSWSYWMYYAGGSEPGGHGGQGGLRVASNRNATLDALVVPYPEEIAGTPTSYSLSRSDWEMHLSYSTTPADPSLRCTGAATEVIVPTRDYPHGYSVSVTGGHVVSPPTWPWVEIVADHGATSVAMTLRPASGSHTDVPTTAIDPKAPVPTCHG